MYKTIVKRGKLAKKKENENKTPRGGAGGRRGARSQRPRAILVLRDESTETYTQVVFLEEKPGETIPTHIPYITLKQKLNL
jgi:hypothetical protein